MRYYIRYILHQIQEVFSANILDTIGVIKYILLAIRIVIKYIIAY